ncbi:hypothetical protein AB0M46_31905 [Dactylosporangium sp. NPDC051485]|uniref:hypothetical protein n=1 Tax=Dactylosporangium sp. NPDC051485 TaxID=3154846 RepID=UPI00341F68D2
MALTIAAVGLAGCETEVTTGPGTPGQARAIKPVQASASALPPAEALKGAVKALDTTSYNFGIKAGEVSGGGRIDPAAKSANMQLTGEVEKISISMAYIVIAPNLWFKGDFGDELNQHWGLKPGAWLLIDKTKLTSTASLPINDAGAPELGVTELFKDGLSAVERADATHFTGTVDMTLANSILAPSEDTLKGAGAKAKAVPFTATTDAEGRLTSFKIDGAGIDPNLSMELTFTGFGSIQPVTKPSNATKAPDSVYDLFN